MASFLLKYEWAHHALHGGSGLVRLCVLQLPGAAHVIDYCRVVQGPGTVGEIGNLCFQEVGVIPGQRSFCGMYRLLAGSLGRV